VKFGFVAKHRKHRRAWPVLFICEALGVSRSGFYAWMRRPRSQRSLDDEVLGGQVHPSFVGSDRTYGARRIWHDVLALGQRCGLHRIEQRVRLQALRARPRRRGLPADQGERSVVADNLLDRQFGCYPFQVNARGSRLPTNDGESWSTSFRSGVDHHAPVRRRPTH